MDAVVRCRISTSIATSGAAYRRGQIVELPHDTAHEWAARGMVTIEEAPGGNTPVAAPKGTSGSKSQKNR